MRSRKIGFGLGVLALFVVGASIGIGVQTRVDDSELKCEGALAQTLASRLKQKRSWDPQTVSIGVWYQGEPVLQCQRPQGWGVSKKWDLWSVSKSLLHAVVGWAVKEEGLSLEERYGSVRVQDLLEFRSGIQWKESYEWNPFRSSIIRALFDPARNLTLEDFVLSHGLGEQKARYSSGDSMLLAYWLNSRGITAARIQSEVFPKLGLEGLVVETDSNGVWVASSFTYGTFQHLRQLGELYRIRQLGELYRNPSSAVLPENWSSRLWEAQALAKPGWSLLPHWWSFKPQSSNLPSDWLVASGHWGQALFLSRSEPWVVARLGQDRFSRFDWSEFLEALVASRRGL
jgi:hypothetical protein